MADVFPGARPARPLVVTGSDALLDELVRLVAAAGGEADVAVDPVAARPFWQRAPLVLIGDDVARESRPGGVGRRDGVVLVAFDPDDTDAYARGVAWGAEAVTFLPADEQWLVRRIADAFEGDGSGAFVVGVVGGRGGAGATTLAAALAITARRLQQQVLLIDADPLGSGVDLVLGGDAAAGLRWSGLVDTSGRVSASALRDALPTLCDLSVLAFDRLDRSPISADVMRAVLDAGCRNHDVVVVDLPRYPDEAVRMVLDRADLTLLVVPAELRATAAAARVAEVIGLLAADVRVVVRGPAPGKLDADTIAGCLGLPLAGALRAEPNIAALLDQGVPPARRGRGPLARMCTTVLSHALSLPSRSAA